MAKASRGGLTLKTGKVGRVNCLRQQMLMPGERMNVRIKGSVRMESLRERDVMRINAHLGIFWTPLRWLDSDWPDYIKQGSDTSISLPATAGISDLSNYGVGTGGTSYTYNMRSWFKDSLLRIYNEWYKWPENADATTWEDGGNKAVPLSKTWTRLRALGQPDNPATPQVGSTTIFDIRTLAETEAAFKSEMKKDVLSFDRWMELVRNTWKGSDPSREVDQVPIMIDQVEVGVSPRDLPATDGSSLGTWQSLYDFDIDHAVRGIVAPEHGILTYLLTVRFPSITDTMMPLSGTGPNYYEITADPEYLASLRPQGVNFSELFPSGSTSHAGYLPAGWQWRSDHDTIDEKIYKRNSFPYMLVPTTFAQTKDATRIKPAFRSQSLGDYLVDCYITENSEQPIGTAMDSYFSGMVDDTRNLPNSSDEFPHGGKQL
jgi:hypothetical protein